MKHPRTAVRRALLACCIAAALPAWAQDEAAPTPMAAEIAPRAVENLLTAITRVGDQRLVTVGSRGHILISDDAGKNWQQVAVPVNGLLTAVTFADAKVGWAVGYDAVVLKTTDGGQTWVLKNFQPDQEPLLEVMFLDAQRGFALGAYGVMMKTADGGETWEAQENELTEEGMHLNAMTRLNDGRLMIVGEAGMIATSSDEGETWVRGEFPYEGSLFTVRADGEKGAIVAGLRGNAFRSIDGANDSWETIATASERSVFGIEPFNGGYLLVGLNSSALQLDAEGKVSELGLKALSKETDTLAVISREDAAYADVLVLGDEIITVGDAGVKRWAVR